MLIQNISISLFLIKQIKIFKSNEDNMKNDRIIDANNVNVKILIHILLLCDSETIYMKEIIKPPIRKIKTKKENHDTISIKKNY